MVKHMTARTVYSGTNPSLMGYEETISSPQHNWLWDLENEEKYATEIATCVFQVNHSRNGQ